MRNISRLNKVLLLSLITIPASRVLSMEANMPNVAEDTQTVVAQPVVQSAPGRFAQALSWFKDRGTSICNSKVVDYVRQNKTKSALIGASGACALAVTGYGL